jgi:hypothetical protein
VTPASPADAPASDDGVELVLTALDLVDDAIRSAVRSIAADPRFLALEGIWSAVAWLLDHCEGPDGVRVEILDLGPARTDGRTDPLEAALGVRSGETGSSASRTGGREIHAAVVEDRLLMPGGQPLGLLLVDRGLAEGVAPALLRGLDRLGREALAPVVLHGAPSAPEPTARRADPDIRDGGEYLVVAGPGILVPRLGGGHDGWVPAGVDASRILVGGGWALVAAVADSVARTGWFIDVAGVFADGPDAFDGPARGRGVSARYDRCGAAAAAPVSEWFGPHDLDAFDGAGFTVVAGLSQFGRMTLHNARPRTPSHELEGVRCGIPPLALLLAVLRIGHYVTAIGRRLIGSTARAERIEGVLSGFLADYCEDREDLDDDRRLLRPLRRSRVAVTATPGRAGGFGCRIELEPHTVFASGALRLSLDDLRLGGAP